MESEWKKIALLRIQSWPADVKVAFGSGEQLTRDELIEHVKKEDALGKEIIEMQLKYMKSLKSRF